MATGVPSPETALLGTNWHHWRLSPTRGPRAEHDGFFRGMTASKRRHLLVLLHSFAPQEQQLDQGLRAICAEGQDDHIPFCRLCFQTSSTGGSQTSFVAMTMEKKKKQPPISILHTVYMRIWRVWVVPVARLALVHHDPATLLRD